MRQKDILKKIFTEEGVPVPILSTDFAWQKMNDRLNKELPQNNKRKRALTGLLFFLLLMTGSGIYFFKSGTGRSDSTHAARPEADKSNNKTIVNANGKSGKTETFQSPLMPDTDTIGLHEKYLFQTAKNLLPANEKIQSESSRTDKKIKAGKQQKLSDKEIFNEEETAFAFEKNARKIKSFSTRQKINAVVSAAEPSTDSSGLSLQNNKSPVNPPILVTDKKSANVDSSSAQEQEKDKTQEAPVKIRLGVQWHLQIPFAGAGNYFAASGGKSVPELFAIPACWITAQVERSTLSLEIAPYFSFLTPVKIFRTVLTYSNTGDTVKINTDSRKLNKLSGTALYAGYGYQLKNNWWIKGGLQMQWWRSGLATSDMSHQQYPVNNPAEKKTISSSQLITMTGSDWIGIQKFQVNVNAELAYTFRKWETALRIGLPFSPVSNENGAPKNSMRAELIVRYRLFEK